MSSFSLFILISCFLPSMASIQSCGSAKTQFQIQSVSLQPDPPIRGQSVKLMIEFINPGDLLTDGKVSTSVSINYIPFPSQTTPLCEYTECPITKGQQIRSSQTIWPEHVSGRIASKIVWKDNSDNELVCIQLLISVS